MRSFCCGVSCVVLLTACGARTDLPHEERSTDASLIDVVGSDAGTGCRGLPLAPTELVRDPSFAPKAVALRGDTLFFGVVDERPLSEEQTGGIYRMQVRGGVYERLELSQPYYGNTFGLLVGVDYIVYHQVRATRTGAMGWAFSYPAIVIERDRRDVRVLVTELEPEAGRASAMALLGDRIFFGRHRAAPDSERGNVGRYEIRADEETTLLERADVRAAIGSARHAYLWLYDGGDGVLLRVTAASDVIELERYPDFSCCWPWAADNQALYFRRGDAIERRPIGEEPVTIAEATTRAAILPAAVDERYLYWADSASIHYVDKEGGRVETLVDGGTAFVEGLATDGCGVYYSVVNPPRVMAIAAPD